MISTHFSSQGNLLSFLLHDFAQPSLIFPCKYKLVLSKFTQYIYEREVN